MGNKITHIIVRRIENNAFRLTMLHNFAIFHNGNMAAKLQRFVKIVADKNNGLLQLFLQLQKLVLQLSTDQRVQCGKRLIH